MKIIPGINFINRKTGKSYSSSLLPSESAPKFRFKTDMLNFSDVFEFKIGLPKGSTYDFGSHDFVEFFYNVNGKKYEIGVGYIEDFNDSESDSEITLTANGRDLMGRMIDVPFRKGLTVKDTNLLDIYLRLCADEYVHRYSQIKGKKGYIKADNIYDGKLLLSVRSDQLKGRVLQRYTNELALNIAYVDEKGFINIRGRKPRPDSIKGTLTDSGDRPNVSLISVSQKLSSVYSDALIQYSAGEANASDANKIGNPIVNQDQRVKGIVNRRFIEPINIPEARDFAGSVDPKARANQIANHKIRTSNRALSTVSVSSSLPFVLDRNNEVTPFRIGDFWRLKSYRPKFRTSENPQGTSEVVMLLAGILYDLSEVKNSFELLFIEPDTVC